LFKILSYHVSGATNVIYENRRIISSKMAWTQNREVKYVYMQVMGGGVHSVSHTQQDANTRDVYMHLYFP
jgi:hypothetical protein